MLVVENPKYPCLVLWFLLLQEGFDAMSVHTLLMTTPPS
jgi:hypothetical protein